MTGRRPDKTWNRFPVESSLDCGVRLDLLFDKRVDSLPNQRCDVGFSQGHVADHPKLPQLLGLQVQVELLHQGHCRRPSACGRMWLWMYIYPDGATRQCLISRPRTFGLHHDTRPRRNQK